MERKVIVLDHTLRDGEQQALVNFSQEQKLELAKSIAGVGVDYIDLMPIASGTERVVAERLSSYPLLISTPLTDESINLAIKLKKDIVLFQAVSDSLLQIRGKTRSDNINDFKDKLLQIREKAGHDLKIYVAGEDTSRANQKYLVEFLRSIENDIDGFFIADSVGYLIPEKTRELVEMLKTQFSFLVGIHAHNDLGFAVDNTIAAALAGADIISGTFTGLGERAGNADLGTVLRRLRDEQGLILDQINYDCITAAEKLVQELAGAGPARPLSKEAFYVESGIHVHALLQHPTAYSLIDPSLLGYKHEVFFSKKSGISNFKWHLGDQYSQEVYGEWRDKIKNLSIQKNRSFTFEEVRELLDIQSF